MPSIIVSAEEYAAYKKSGKEMDIFEYCEYYRNKKSMIEKSKKVEPTIIEVEPKETKDIKIKSDREKIMDLLEEKGVEFKKNAKTADLKKLLEGE